MANSPELSFVGDTNAQSRAFDFIKEEILSMRLRPLQRLNAGEIASKLGLSRTPIREALTRLEHDRLVIRDEGGGFSVRPISLREILDFYRVREALEVEAALESLPHMSPALIAKLWALLERAELLLEPTKYAEFVLANREFHAAIVEASGNSAFDLIMAPIVDRVRLVGAMLIRLHAPRQAQVYEENRSILLALESGNAAEVERAVRAHVQRAREHAERLLGANLGSLVLHAL
jgi:DNA-binding GntR family transcriptional regulator